MGLKQARLDLSEAELNLSQMDGQVPGYAKTIFLLVKAVVVPLIGSLRGLLDEVEKIKGQNNGNS